MARISANFLYWQWDAIRYRAASRLATGEMKDEEIAAEAGITSRQLRGWKQYPPFAALVDAITAEAASLFHDEAVATKAGRLRILIDMHNKLLAVIEARAKRYAEEREWAAGESTGVIVTKETWGKVNSHEAAVDAGLLKQLLDYQEQIAIESGQRDKSIAVKHSGRVDHVHRVNRYDALTDEELEQLEQVAKKLALGEAAG